MNPNLPFNAFAPYGKSYFDYSELIFLVICKLGGIITLLGMLNLKGSI